MPIKHSALPSSALDSELVEEGDSPQANHSIKIDYDSFQIDMQENEIQENQDFENFQQQVISNQRKMNETKTFFSKQ